MPSTTRTLLLLILVSASAAGPAQDMVGPSGSTEAATPVMQPAEPAERVDDARSGTRDASAIGSAGEAEVQRADAESDDGRASVAAPAGIRSDAQADSQAQAQAGASSGGDVEEAGANGQSALDERYEASWNQHMDNADYEAAAALARSWLASIERDRDRDQGDAFAPLVRLGQALEGADDPVGASVAMSRAVEIAENAFGVFDIRLSRPLNALGRALLRQGRAEDAVPVLMRAKDITHRNLGIYNLEQEAIVQSLADCFLQTGDWLQATREQRFLLGANEKAYGENSLELVPALQRWAKWNVFVGRHDVGRKYFRQALDILENEYGTDDLRLIETLDMVANSYFQAAVARWPREGVRSLERIVDIYRAQEFVDQADLMRAQTRVGDWLMRARRPREAVEAYQAAISAAQESGMDADAITAIYGWPQPLHGNNRPLNNPLGNRFSDESDVPRYVMLEYTVDRNGRARHVTVIEDTVRLMSVTIDLKDRIMSTAFRPRFTADGEPVETRGLRYVFELDSDGNYGEPAMVFTGAAAERAESEVRTPPAEAPTEAPGN